MRTTRTDSVPDAGTVDLGCHFPTVGALEIFRGTDPRALSSYRTVPVLPFSDDPGTLSDPSLRRLFYRIPVAVQPIRVEKDIASDAVVLRF